MHPRFSYHSWHFLFFLCFCTFSFSTLHLIGVTYLNAEGSQACISSPDGLISPCLLPAAFESCGHFWFCSNATCGTSSLLHSPYWASHHLVNTRLFSLTWLQVQLTFPLKHIFLSILSHPILVQDFITTNLYSCNIPTACVLGVAFPSSPADASTFSARKHAILVQKLPTTPNQTDIKTSICTQRCKNQERSQATLLFLLYSPWIVRSYQAPPAGFPDNSKPSCLSLH